MEQTKPRFVIRKYRSVLRAAIIVEAVNYIVSLTDGIVAGSYIGDEALLAVGLSAPFLAVSTFLASIVNTGTVLNYSYHVGRFDKKRATEFFSQGIWMALMIGILYSAVMFLLREPLIALTSSSTEIAEQMRDYYNIILLFFLLNPISYLLDNTLVADGGEKLSALANVVLIISNVTLSVLFVGFWGIRGIAFASVISKLLFILIICTHYLSKKNTLKLIRYWKAKDCLTIIKSGIVKASTYILEGILAFSINLFALYYFQDDTLLILVVVERLLGLTTLFIGLAMAAQPLIGTLRGEDNTKALRELMKTVLKDMIIAASVITILTIVFAPYLANAFGIDTEDGPLYIKSIIALRIVGATLVFHAVLVLFFIYFVQINQNRLAFMICLHKNLLSPMIMGVLFTILIGSQTGLWIGFAVSPVVVLVSTSLEMYFRYGKELFPFLIPKTNDKNIYIYDFKITQGIAVELSQTIHRELEKTSVSVRNRTLTSVFAEELLMLILEKNPNKQIRAECTLIIIDDGLKIILRDSGVIFDLTNEDAAVSSFRQYIVANMMVKPDHKAYMITTGYNRNELLFKDEKSSLLI